MAKVVAARRGIEELLDLQAPMRRVADGFHFTEGPIWDKASQSLLFSDIRNDSRWRWSEATGAHVEARPNFIGNGMVFDAAGDLLICEHVTSSVVAERGDGSRRIVAYNYQGKYLNSPNDVVTRSDGLVYFTDPDYGRWDHAVGVARKRDLDFLGLFRVRPGHDVELAAPPDTFDQPNGLCFSPDETRLYVDDLHGIREFVVHPDGSLSDGHVFCPDMGSPPGIEDGDPDGMKCDAAGNIWCAARGGVWIVSPSGEVLGVLETDEIVANLTWGGPEWKTLFLCTSTSIQTIETKVPSARLPYH